MAFDLSIGKPGDLATQLLKRRDSHKVKSRCPGVGTALVNPCLVSCVRTCAQGLVCEAASSIVGADSLCRVPGFQQLSPAGLGALRPVEPQFPDQGSEPCSWVAGGFLTSGPQEAPRHLSCSPSLLSSARLYLSWGARGPHSTDQHWAYFLLRMPDNWMVQ